MIITVNNALIILCLFYFTISAFIFYLFRKANLFFKVIVFFFILSTIITVAEVNRIEVTLSVVFGFFVIYRESIIELFLDCKYWLESTFDFIKSIIFTIGKIFLWFGGIFKLFKFSGSNDSANNNNRDNPNQQQGSTENQTKQNQSRKNQEQQERIRQAKEDLRKIREEQENKDNRSNQDILGLNKGFTLADLKKAHRLAVSRYHPDKYSHMSETFQKESEAQLVKVQGAYNELLKRFN